MPPCARYLQHRAHGGVWGSGASPLSYPTRGNEATLDLTSLAPRQYQAQVLDLAGRGLLAHAFVGGEASAFDVHGLPAGAYVVVITRVDTHQALRLLRN